MNKLTQDFARWARDAAEQAFKAAVATFTSLLIGSSVIGVDGVVDMALLERAGIAAGGAALSALVSLAAKWVGDPGTASFSK